MNLDKKIDEKTGFLFNLPIPEKQEKKIKGAAAKQNLLKNFRHDKISVKATKYLLWKKIVLSAQMKNLMGGAIIFHSAPFPRFVNTNHNFFTKFSHLVSPT